MRWSLFICCVLLSVDVWAQVPEQSTFTNIDTALIHRKIAQGSQIAGLKPDSAKWLFYEAYLLSRSMAYKPGAQWALTNLGHTYNRESQYDSARRYYFLALAYSDTLQDSLFLARIFNSIGKTYATRLQSSLAMAAFMKAGGYAISSPYDLAASYCNIGNVFSRIGNNGKAMQYLDLSLQLAIASKDTSTWCGVLMNKGNVFSRLKNMDSALYYLDSAFRMSKAHHLVREFVTTAVNLSDLHLDRGSLDVSETIMGQALLLYDSSVLHARERNMLLIQAGKVYAALSRFDLAIDYLQQALYSVQGDTYHELVILEALSELYESNGDYRAALHCLRSLYALQDSLGSVEVSSKVNELETQYRTAQKDKTIAEGQLKIQAQELRLNRQRNWVGAAISGLLLLLLLASWRYTHMRQKNRRLQSQMEVEQLKSEMAGEQKERARIASELHDGIVAELTAIKMNLEVSGNRLPEAPLAYRTHLKELSTVINEVRNTAHNLMPEILLKHGLAEAVGLLCETLEKTGRLEMDYQHYGDFAAISQPMRQSVYRIIQELLHNIIKHAKASKALLQLSSNDGLLTIELEDDGVGMKGRSGHSMGLSNIERRVKELRGRVAWSSPAAGSGTQVHLEFEV